MPSTPRIIIHRSDKVAWTIRNLVWSSIPIHKSAIAAAAESENDLFCRVYTYRYVHMGATAVSLQTNQFCSIFLIELAKKGLTHERQRETTHTVHTIALHVFSVAPFSSSLFSLTTT